MVGMFRISLTHVHVYTALQGKASVILTNFL